MRVGDLFYRRTALPADAPVRKTLLVHDAGSLPADQAGRSLILIHGHYWRDGAGHDFDPGERSFLFEPFRSDGRYQELRRHYAIFTFLYPTHESYEFSSVGLADTIRSQLPAPSGARDLTIVAHSMGGLVARYALQHQGIGDRLRSLVTLATPHHGTILASMIMANQAVRRKVGWLGYLLQRLGRRIWCPSPGMAGMAADNADLRIAPHEETHFGIAVNHRLAALNLSDPYVDRLVCVMGRVRGWWIRGRNFWDQIPRWFMGRLDPVFRGLDPLVHLESGLAEGLPVAARHVLDDLDHEGIVTAPRTHEILYRLLLPTFEDELAVEVG